jgi:hypothetical protein
MSNAITISAEDAKVLLQSLDATVRAGGLNAAAIALPVAQRIQEQLNVTDESQ